MSKFENGDLVMTDNITSYEWKGERYLNAIGIVLDNNEWFLGKCNSVFWFGCWTEMPAWRNSFINLDREYHQTNEYDYCGDDYLKHLMEEK